MDNITVINISVPDELLVKLHYISDSFNSDLNSDVVNLLQCYVDSFQKLHSDPAAKVLLGGK